ncbi:MAG: hypothetical protein AB7N71_00675 [Phycisphaerae bacterium]
MARPVLSRVARFQILVCVGACGAVATIAAERPPRAAKSENEVYEVRIEPGKDESPCIATMLDLKRGRDGEIWSRELVNETAPMQLFVRDDGKMLITLDEARRGGARNALVIYGEKGQLLRHWLLPDLLEKGDWAHVKKTKHAIEWLDGAKCGFDENDAFVIRLKWDREIVIDLKRLAIVGKNASAESIPAGFEDLLAFATETSDIPTSDEFTEAAELVSSDDAPIENEVAMSSEESAAPVQDPDAARAEMLKNLWNAKADDSEEAIADLASRPVHEGPEAVQATGIAEPLPDPRNPVDYLNWLNLNARVSDPEAINQMRLAVENYAEFSGDQELFDRAMAGDLDALASPEVAAFREANRAAIQHFRDFSLFQYEGVPLHSPDGSMIGALLPQLGPLRSIAKAAVIEGKALAAEGRTAEAVDLYLDSLRAGGQSGKGTTLIENLVGHAIQSMVSDALLDLTASADPSAIDFADVAERLEFDYARPSQLAQSMQYERAMMMDTVQRSFVYDENAEVYMPNMRYMQDVFGMVGDAPAIGPLALLKFATLDFEDTVASSNEVYDRLTEASSSPYFAGQEQMRAVEEGLVADMQTNPLISGMIPALSRTNALWARSESRRRGSILLSNILAYEQQHGAPPPSLDAFADREFVTDPMTGQPFAYQIVDGAFQLTGSDLPPNGTPEAEAGVPAVAKQIWPRPPK